MSQYSLNQNQFTQAPVIGQVAFQPNVDTETCQINPNTAATYIQAGCAVKLIANAGPEIVVDVTSGPSDGPVYGVIAYNPRINKYGASDRVEIASTSNIIYLKSSAAINRGNRVSVTNPTTSTNDATVASDATAGDSTIGFALTQVSGANQLVKVKIAVGSNSTTGLVTIAP
jgi:hypothetical protein